MNTTEARIQRKLGSLRGRDLQRETARWVFHSQHSTWRKKLMAQMLSEAFQKHSGVLASLITGYNSLLRRLADRKVTA